MQPSRLIICATSVFISLFVTFPVHILAAPVNTYGDLKVNGLLDTTGGIKFSDGSTLNTSGLNGMLFNVGLVVDNSQSNTGTINSGAIKFGSDLSGEGIGSQQTLGANKNGLDFYTNYLSRLSILNNGFVGIGTRSPDSALTVTSPNSSPVHIGDTGCGVDFAGIGLFGAMSGCSNYTILGDNRVPQNLFINRPTGGEIYFRMNNGNQMILEKFGGLMLDANDANSGAFNHSATTGAGLAFGYNSGEGIASKRTKGGNVYGLDFYTSGTPRLSITFGGNVGIGTTTPSQALEVVGTVNATQFNGSGLGLTGVQKKYGGIAIVATSGGDYNDPAVAMADYAQWCGTTPSATAPCLLKIMPGVYSVTSPVVMRSYIDIEGSGEKVTIITSGLGDKVSPPSVATVKGSDLAELRFLTVENTGSGSVSVAILNINASVSLVFVTASVLNGGDAYGVYTFGSTRIKMQNLTATASGTVNCFGVYNSSSVITMSDVTATATSRTGGANSYGIYNSGSVPTMTNVTANAVGTDGGENSYGIYSSSASFTMKNVTASALGAKNNYGIYNHGIYSTTPTMTNVIASAYGGAGKINSYAVYNDSSSLTMTNVTAIASGASNNYGISNNTNGTIKINNSVIKAINTVDNNGTVQTFIGNSQLDGGWGFNNGTGSLTCVGVYGAAYLGLSSACN